MRCDSQKRWKIPEEMERERERERAKERVREGWKEKAEKRRVEVEAWCVGWVEGREPSGAGQHLGSSNNAGKMVKWESVRLREGRGKNITWSWMWMWKVTYTGERQVQNKVWNIWSIKWNWSRLDTVGMKSSSSYWQQIRTSFLSGLITQIWYKT